jgi:PAS domain S-box-containing protein
MAITDPVPDTRFESGAVPVAGEHGRDDFRTIVEHCSTAIVLQRDRRIVYANRAAVDCFEFTSQADLIGQPVELLFDVDSYATLASNFHKATPHDDQLFIGELKLRRKSGAVMHAEIYHSGLVFGGADATMISIRDVTATKSLELDLQQAQKLESIGRLAARLAHEINTPIQYIGDSAHYIAELVTGLLDFIDKSRADLRTLVFERRGEAGLAELDAEEEAADLDFMRIEGPRSVERIKGGATHVARIVSAMKSFSHPGGEEASPMDVNKIVEDTLVIAGHELKDTATVTTKLAALPQIYGYPADLNQALLNLVVNAAHAVADRLEGSEPGFIHVSTRLCDGEIEIAVTDNGCGMPDYVKERLFEPFFTTKQVGRGTGQGMTIVRSAVHKHGGGIDFQSTVGVGTRFVLRLPVERGG